MENGTAPLTIAKQPWRSLAPGAILTLGFAPGAPARQSNTWPYDAVIDRVQKTKSPRSLSTRASSGSAEERSTAWVHVKRDQLVYVPFTSEVVHHGE